MIVTNRWNRFHDDPVSPRVFHLAVFGDGWSGDGSGFLWYAGPDEWWLVTNRHVLEGSKVIEVTFPRSQDKKGDSDDCIVVVVAANDEAGRPRWVAHRNPVVDVAALRIDQELLQCALANNYEEFLTHDEKLVDSRALSFSFSGGFGAPGFRVGSDVFVVGFPFGKMDLYPIWKRGTVATAPTRDFGGEPKFLVDTVTRPGMSGSPVISLAVENERPVGRLPEGKRYSDYRPRFHYRLEGIYSGRMREYDDMHRLLDDEEDSLILAQLGIVWRRQVIDELFWSLE